MVKNYDALNYFLDIYQNFTDAFPDMDFYEENNCFIQEWNESKIDNYNFFLIDDHVKSNISENAINWQGNNSLRKIFVSESFPFNTNKHSKSAKLLLEWRNNKISFPDLLKYEIKKYSYQNHNINEDFWNQIQIIKEMIIEGSENEISIERLIIGKLQLQEGELWVLENEDGNLVSISLISSLDNKSVMIEFLITHKAMRNRNFGKLLLQAIIFENRKKNIICFIDETDINSRLSNKFNFNLVKRFKVFQNKS